MTPDSRMFTARLLVAAGGFLLLFGWLFLRAGTGAALLTLGIVLVATGIAFDRSRTTLLSAAAALALGASVLALLTLPAFF